LIGRLEIIQTIIIQTIVIQTIVIIDLRSTGRRLLHLAANPHV
jgi:hypothetical protein